MSILILSDLIERNGGSDLNLASVHNNVRKF